MTVQAASVQAAAAPAKGFSTALVCSIITAMLMGSSFTNQTHDGH